MLDVLNIESLINVFLSKCKLIKFTALKSDFAINVKDSSAYKN